MAMSYLVKIIGKNGEEKRYPVAEEVANYIQQLEICVNTPEDCKLKEIYSKRFWGLVAQKNDSETTKG